MEKILIFILLALSVNGYSQRVLVNGNKHKQLKTAKINFTNSTTVVPTWQFWDIGPDLAIKDVAGVSTGWTMHSIGADGGPQFFGGYGVSGLADFPFDVTDVQAYFNAVSFNIGGLNPAKNYTFKTVVANGTDGTFPQTFVFGSTSQDATYIDGSGYKLNTFVDISPDSGGNISFTITPNQVLINAMIIIEE